MAGAQGSGHEPGHRVAFACLALLIACGVGTFVGLRGTVHDLDRSLGHFYDDTRFADLVVIGGALDSDLIHLVRQIDTSTYVVVAAVVLAITALVLGISLLVTAPRDER